ncbi:MAG TPA: ATP-binding protein [Clostridium sp.]
MLVNKGELIFYGVDDITENLDNIIKALNIKKQCFEIKLIIVEAVNNAFIHGNNSDKNKPISIKWELKENVLIVSVTDCGSGVTVLRNYEEVDEDNILGECGRGLYLINCYTDEMKFKGSSIIMKKYLL